MRLMTILTAAAVFLIGVTYPYHNWDVIGYVGAAYHQDGFRGTALRDRTYDDVKSAVHPVTFEHLIGGSYRQTVYQDPRALEQQIPFYSVKIVYVELIRAAGRSGLSYAHSTHLISALFSALSVAVLGMLSLRMRLPAIVIPLLALGAGHSEVARGSLPDALACFASLLTVFFALKRSPWAYPLVALLPLMRTDYVILSALLMAYEYCNGQRKQAVLTLIAALAVYAGVNAIWGGYGWLTLFNFTLVMGATPYPAEMPIAASLSDYLVPYTRVWAYIVRGHLFVIYCLAAFVIIVEFGRQKSSREFWMVFVIPFVFFVLHLLLFPLYEDRFFGFSASLLLLGIFVLIRRASPMTVDGSPPGR